MFSIEFSFLEYCLAGGALCLSVVLLSLLLPRLLRVRRQVMADGAVMASVAETADDATPYPPVSVIVTADDDAWNLSTLLPDLLAQDYPAPMEVIVVDNGEGGPSQTVVAQLQPEHPNLYLTFAPSRSRNLSRKKLAVTLGVKAAGYEHLILTNGNCRIASPLWLRAMCRHFADGKDVVVGYSYPAPADADDARESRGAAFSRVRGALQWLGSAIKGNVWRADGNNLGYTRSLFYANRGFQSSLNLKYGDDDIFIREIATPENSAVELSPESFVEELEQDLPRAHRLDRIHRDFTARRLPSGPRRWWGLISIVWCCYLLVTAAVIVVGLPSLVPLIAASVLALITGLTVDIFWRRTMGALASRKLCLTVGWFLTVHPFSTLAYRIRGRRARYTNFTWTTEK